MKKLLLLVALCFCASVASAQAIETVYLKNGSRIRGVITEQIPGKQLKIQTSDGNVFVCSFDEIEKITKELPAKTLHPLSETGGTTLTPHRSVLITKAERILGIRSASVVRSTERDASMSRPRTAVA